MLRQIGLTAGFPKLSRMAVKTVSREVSDLKLWRYEELRMLGVSPDDAISLMEKNDVVAAATKLSEAGCPIEIIVDLLKD